MQLIAENEANDDLTEQLEQAYKAGYKTRQENLSKAEENQRLQAHITELETQIRQIREQKEDSKKEGGCDSCIEYIKRMKRLEFDL